MIKGEPKNRSIRHQLLLPPTYQQCKVTEIQGAACRLSNGASYTYLVLIIVIYHMVILLMSSMTIYNNLSE